MPPPVALAGVGELRQEEHRVSVRRVVVGMELLTVQQLLDEPDVELLHQVCLPLSAVVAPAHRSWEQQACGGVGAEGLLVHQEPPSTFLCSYGIVRNPTEQRIRDFEDLWSAGRLLRFGHPRGGGRARVSLRSIFLCDWWKLANCLFSLVASLLFRVELRVDPLAVLAHVLLLGRQMSCGGRLEVGFPHPISLEAVAHSVRVAEGRRWRGSCAVLLAGDPACRGRRTRAWRRSSHGRVRMGSVSIE